MGPVTRTVVLYTDTSGFGGAEVHLLSLAQRLDRHRFRPVVMYSPSPAVAPLQTRLAELAIEATPVPAMRGVRDLPHVIRLAWRLRRMRADVFHAHKTQPVACRFGLLAAVLSGCGAVLSTDQLRPLATPSARQRLLVRALVRRMSALVAVSRSVADYLVSVLGVPSGRVRVVPNWVEPDEFAREADRPAVRAALGVTDGTAVVLMVARFDEQKRHGDLVAAAQQLRARGSVALFVLAGDGPTRERVEREVNAAGLRAAFRFLGHRNDVPALLAAADVVVLSSHYEGCPISVLEAMAAGRPVVATLVAGTAEVVESGVTGLLVPIGDTEGLADALGRLLSDPGQRVAMGEAGRRRVCRDFAADPLVRRIEALYEAGLAR